MPRSVQVVLIALAGAALSITGQAAGQDIVEHERDDPLRSDSALRFEPEAAVALSLLQEPTEPVSSDDWVFRGGGYAALSGIDGDATVAGVTAELDLSFSDLFDNFDIVAFSGHVEAWKGGWQDGDWGIIFDFAYLDVDGTFDTPGAAPLDIDVDIKVVQIDLGLAYRVVDKPIGNGYHLRVDAMGGLRYQYLKEELTIDPMPTLGDSADWLEPFVGGRVTIDLNERTAILVKGDASGFGIGSASELTWNLLAALEYRLNDKYTLGLGYKVQGFDYSKGSGPSQFGGDWTTEGLALTLQILF